MSLLIPDGLGEFGQASQFQTPRTDPYTGKARNSKSYQASRIWGKGLGPAFPDRQEEAPRSNFESPGKAGLTLPALKKPMHPTRLRVPSSNPARRLAGARLRGAPHLGARERDAALGPKQGLGGESATARPESALQSWSRQGRGGTRTAGPAEGRDTPAAPPSPPSGAPSSPPPHSAAPAGATAPAHAHCSPRCGSRGRGGKGRGRLSTEPRAPRVPTDAAPWVTPRILGAGGGAGLRAQGPDVAEVRRRGARVRGGGGPAPPARSLTSAMAVCAREAVAAPGSPDTEPRAHWLRRLGRRGLMRAWPVRAGRGRGVVGARTGLRGMCAGAGRAREARVGGLGLGVGRGGRS